MTKHERAEQETALGGCALATIAAGAYALRGMAREGVRPWTYFATHWILFLVILGLMLGTVVLAWEPSVPPGRSRSKPQRARRGKPSRPSAVDPAWLHDVVDGYTLLPLAPTEPIYVCSKCRTLYGKESKRTIREVNAGHCLQCGGARLLRFSGHAQRWP